MNYRIIKKAKHYVFESKEEFESFFLAHDGVVPPLVTDWHKGKDGDWVLTDDGGVTEIINVKTYRKANNTVITFVYTTVGAFIRKGNRRDKYPYFMDSDISAHPKRTSLMSAIDHGIVKVLSTKDKAFIFQMIAGVDPIRAVMNCYNVKSPLHKLKKLMNSEKVVDAMRNEVKKIAKKAGYDDAYVLKGLAKLYEKAKSEHIKLDAIVKLGEIIGTIETENSTQSGLGVAAVFQGFNPDRLSGVNDNKLLGEEDGTKEADFEEEDQ